MIRSSVSLVAFAALSNAATAQSSVALYGVLDVSVNYQSQGARVNNGDSSWRVTSSGAPENNRGSRWGMRVTEELGGGLRAFAIMESGIGVDTGTLQQNGRIFGRQAYVGLGSKAWGEIRMGRQTSISRDMMQIIDPGSNATAVSIREGVSIQRAGFGLAGNTTTDAYQMFGTYGDRRDNAVQYFTPNLGGFTASVLVAAGEGSIPRTGGAKVVFSGGPLAVAASYERAEKAAASGGAGGKSLILGGRYDIGAAKLYAGYNQVKEYGFVSGGSNGFAVSPLVKDSTAYALGAAVPLGTATTLLATFVRATFDLRSGGDRTLGKVGVTARHALSKRTEIYAAYERKSGNLAEFATDRSTVTLFGLGHTF